jgi:hypothetical protein
MTDENFSQDHSDGSAVIKLVTISSQGTSELSDKPRSSIGISLDIPHDDSGVIKPDTVQTQPPRSCTSVLPEAPDEQHSADEVAACCGGAPPCHTTAPTVAEHNTAAASLGFMQQRAHNGAHAGQAALSVRTKSAPPEASARASPSAGATQQAMKQAETQQPSTVGSCTGDTNGSQRGVDAAECKQALQEGVSSQEAAAKKLRGTWDAQVCRRPRANVQTLDEAGSTCAMA